MESIESGSEIPRSFRSELVYPRNEARCARGIPAIIWEGRAENDLFVTHPLQLKRRVNDQNQGGPRRCKLDEETDDRNPFGEVEGMAHDGVGPVGNQASRLGHDAERPPQAENDETGKAVAEGNQSRGEQAEVDRQIGSRKGGDQPNRESS